MSSIDTDQLPEQAANAENESVVSTKESKKHLAKNIISNFIFLLFNAATSVYFIKYQNDKLGIANYGMVVLAYSFTQYLPIITAAITGTTSRFVTLQVAKNDYNSGQSYFSTQFFTSLCLALILFPVTIAITLNAPNLVTITPGQTRNTQILFQIVFISALLSPVSAAFRTALAVRQRFDIGNRIEMLSQIGRYGTWILMFNLFRPSIWHIGLGMLVGMAISLSGFYITFVKLTPQLLPRLRKFDIRKLRETLGTGGWLIMSQLGTMLFMAVDPLIINKLMGPSSVGKYGVLLGVSNMLRGVTISIACMFVPVAVACYARKDTIGMVRHTARAVKFMSLIFAIPIGIVCGFLASVLSIWKPEFGAMNILIWVMFSHLVLNLGVEPVFGVTMATNNVRFPSVCAVISGVVKLALAVLFVKYTRMGLVGVALASFISLTLKNVVLGPFYSARVLKIPSSGLYKAMLAPALVFLATAVGGRLLSQAFKFSSFTPLFAIAIAVFGLSCFATYYLALTKDDKRFLIGILPWKKTGACNQES